MSDKRVRCSVAAVVRREDGSFLAVRRPPDDRELPDVWGLPAVTLGAGELPEQGLRRIGTEKLGAQIQPTRFLGIKSADRGDHELILMDIEAQLVGETVPDVARATTSGTRYVEQLWTCDTELLRPAAAQGSLCSQILLEATQSSG